MKVVVLSNCTDRLPEDLRYHGLEPLIGYVFSSASLGVGKPAPAAYLACAREMAVRPGQILFVDDMAPDVHGARSAGLQAELYDAATDFTELVFANIGTGVARRLKLCGCLVALDA
jgi:FMN phosphatase YigB (HAD superfamily)